MMMCVISLLPSEMLPAIIADLTRLITHLPAYLSVTLVHALLKPIKRS